MNKLVPKELIDYLYTGNILPNDKDSKLAVVQNFLINLGELETLNRNDIGSLKSMMTLKKFHIRRPYGHYSEIYFRRSSFMGSVNKNDFISDQTGSRRVLCFSVKKIDYQHSVRTDNVWNQAVHLYIKGEKYWFDKIEIKEIDKHNAKFTFHSIEEEKIRALYKPAKRTDSNVLFMNSTEIAEELFEGKGIDNGTILRIGTIMNKLNYRRYYKNGIKKWALKRID